MHKATCAECGKECEVPFKPDTSRPVYCRECYAKKRPDHHHQDDIRAKLLTLSFQLIHIFFYVILFCLVVTSGFSANKS